VSGRLNVEFTPAEGAVLRMIGLVERRGFDVCGIAMSLKSEPANLELDVEPRHPDRCLEVVARQLGRLVGVRSVSIAAYPGHCR
jgi:acetolactate synthase II small subunit